MAQVALDHFERLTHGRRAVGWIVVGPAEWGLVFDEDAQLVTSIQERLGGELRGITFEVLQGAPGTATATASL